MQLGYQTNQQTEGKRKHKRENVRDEMRILYMTKRESNYFLSDERDPFKQTNTHNGSKG